MTLEKIATLLYDSIGLNAKSIGNQAILDAINIRIDECNLDDIQSYYEKVSTQNSELKELIEEVVIPETWFFRDSKPFKQLIKYASEEWGAKTSFKPIRILSIPCATGEEPYSIAMTMLDAGFMPSQVEIDAVDISKRNIRRCKEAEYRPHSFRGVDNTTRDKFFNPVGDKYQPDILIKAMVNFSQTSILEPALSISRKTYDVVFCRNLLIYFDTETQLKAMSTLNKLLHKDGLLFLGHAETGIFLKSWHLSRKYPKAFIVRKFIDADDGRTQQKSFATTSNKSKLKHTLNINALSSKKTSISAGNNKIVKADTTKEGTPSIAEANKFFGLKNFSKAEDICLTLLEANKKDMSLHFLLGQINFETNNTVKAKKYFHNVIYLSPNNYDALMHLYRIELSENNNVQADRLLQRAKRVKEKEVKTS